MYWNIISHFFWFLIINSSCNRERRNGLNPRGEGRVRTVSEEMRHHSYPQRTTVHGSRSSTVSGNPVRHNTRIHNIIYEFPRRVAYIIISQQYPGKNRCLSEMRVCMCRGWFQYYYSTYWCGSNLGPRALSPWRVAKSVWRRCVLLLLLLLFILLLHCRCWCIACYTYL